MPIIRTKNNVPQVYVSESRDFQLFTRVLDFVQNGLKYDIDAMLNSLSTRDIAENYLEHLQSKIGFFTNGHYDDSTLRKALSAMPYILRNKGSELGISMCINTFLNIIGFRRGYNVSIYHEDEVYDHTIRVGIEGSEINTDILRDMLSYVLPTGYILEFYFYTSVGTPNVVLNSQSVPYVLKDSDYKLISSVRDDTDLTTLYGDTKEREEDTYNTVQHTTVYRPKPQQEE
jgi:hypothetical protein